MYLVILVVAIVFFMLMKKPKTTTTTVVNQKIQLQNELINAYNYYVRLVSSNMSDLITKIENISIQVTATRDEYSNLVLNTISSKIVAENRNINKLLNDLKTTVEALDVNSFQETEKSLQKRLENLSKLSEELDRIEPSVNVFNDDYDFDTQNATINKAQVDLGYFNGCNDLVSLKDRYRALTKVYHPDTKTGDADMFKTITEEYEELRSKFEG